MKQRAAAQKATDKPAKGEKAASGRVTTPKQRNSGRYTPPIPSMVKHSPRWYPFVLLGLVLAGVILIILNYIGSLPDSPSNWYTLGALIGVVIAAFGATGWK